MAYAFCVYVFCADDRCSKKAFAVAFIEGYLRLRNSEVAVFVQSCSKGIDVGTLKLLHELDSTTSLWTAPGIERLNPATNSHCEESWQCLWKTATFAILFRKVNADEVAQRAQEFVTVGSSVFKQFERKAGVDLLTAR